MLNSLQISHWFSLCLLVRSNAQQALIIIVEIIISLGALCSSEFGRGVRASGCASSALLCGPREKQFYIPGPQFSHTTPLYYLWSRSRALKGCPGEMWYSNHPSQEASRLDQTTAGTLHFPASPLGRGSTLLPMHTFVLLSKWCS